MATTTDILRVLLTGDSRGLVDAFKSAQGAAEKMAVAGRALTAGVTLPLVGLGVASVNAASNLNEAASKVGVVFGAQAGMVQDFAETTSEAYGISERAALEAAGTLGNLVVSMGGSQQAAAEMSVELVGLAGDLASFNNLDTADVLEKLRSGLVGEVEPLRSLGVSFDAAAVEAEAMAIAIEDGRSAITEADKVMARYKLIVEQTGTAQGDFERTSDGLANQQRVAQAQLEDSAAALGQSLLPAVADATGAIADLAGKFADLPAPVQETVVKLGLAAAATGPLVLGMSKAITAAKGLGAAMSNPWTAGMALAAGAIGFLTYQILENAAASAEAAERAQELVDAYAEAIAEGDRALANEILSRVTEEQREALDAAGYSLSQFVGLVRDAGSETPRLVNGMSEFNGEILAMYRNGEITLEQWDLLRRAFGSARQGLDEATASVEANAETQREATLATREVGEAFDFWGNQVDIIARSHEDLGEATEHYANQQELAAGSIRSSSQALGPYLSRLRELQGIVLGVSEAEIAYFESLDQVAVATYTNGQNLDLTTEAGRENQQALNDLASTTLGLVTAMDEASASQDEQNFVMANGRQAFIDAATAMGIGTDEAEDLATALGLVPDTVGVGVTIDAPDTSEAEDIGKNIAGGIAHGMDLSHAELAQAAVRAVRAVHNAARDEAGISSPSRLFAEQVGGPISEGVAQGILDALDAPQSAIDELFDELVDRANTGAGDVLSGIGAVFGTGRAQERVDRAEEALAEARTPAERAAAQRDLMEAQLALLQASESMVEAGQELLGQGPGGAERVRQLGLMSGLSEAEIGALLDQLEHAQAWAGQFLPSDVSGLIGTGEPSAAVGANIIINMPPGTDPDQVVAAIEEWVRRNGPLRLPA